MKRLILLALLLLNIVFAYAKEETIPVLIRASSNASKDIDDGDFVKLFNEVVYNEIINNRIVLWDSHSKDIYLMGSTLQDIERNSKTSFKDQKFVYIFENWKRSTREIQATTIGFMFTNKTAAGEDVSYGYIEYKDISSVLQKIKLGVAADGNHNQTLALLLNTKKFNFDILQFAGQPVKSSIDSEKIKQEYIGNLGFNTTLFASSEPQKMVSYFIERSVKLDDELAQNGDLFLDALEIYLLNHLDKIAELGNIDIANLSAPDIKVNRCEVREIWRKGAGSKIIFAPMELIIHINETPLNPINEQRIASYKIEFQGTDLFTFLKGKKFNYIVSSINGQKISRSQAFFYQRALFEANWSNLTGFVKDL
ncbi:MAG: hypothetical protein IPO27_01275 [Bacteroidetes bacterium]|nr:hypothetical protein [Bacteroidota bacterium]